LTFELAIDAVKQLKRLRAAMSYAERETGVAKIEDLEGALLGRSKAFNTEFGQVPLHVTDGNRRGC
jgi:hypothetical protein